MERAVSDVADRVVSRYANLAEGERILIGVAGVPGSGKTTFAYPLTELLNERLGVPHRNAVGIDVEQGLADDGSSTDGAGIAKQIAVSVSLDGWHTTRAELDRMPDPAEARRRRGAAFTFDAQDYVNFVKALKQTPAPKDGVPYRTFSHSKKDPELAPIPIQPHNRIIVIEGLYTLLNISPWKEATDLLDERVWIDCKPDIARERLVARHVRTGVEATVEAARARVDGSDMLNGAFIREHLTEPTYTTEGLVDANFAQAISAKLAAGS